MEAHLMVLGALLTCCMATVKYPNIVFILTDDQDVELDGMQPISKARKLIGDAGITFTNMFATSPLCCPSRSSILTGKYVHNHGAVNNSISGNCSSPAWQQNSETHGFATYLKNRNYKTFFAGKYLNQYGFKATGGVKHIPPGWDWWTGLVGNSRYYDFSLSVNGTKEAHGHKYPQDYLTDIIGTKAQDFLGLQHEDDDNPFFMMLSTPACHAPFTPAPQYKDDFSNMSAPRTGSFNVHGKDKHWLIRQAKTPLSTSSIKYIDPTFRNRWRTLLSVDDIVEQVVNTLDKKKLLHNTYIFYSSDNGFHLGQFSLPNDKRQMYEFDIRVPLMVRGPGIKAGQVKHDIALTIDFAPTFIDIAGGVPASEMDGASLRTVLHSDEQNWRTDFVVEHTGEHKLKNKKCPQYKNQPMANCFPDCVCEDSYNNTYSCIRSINKQDSYMYCEFADNENFVEVYDLNKDPHQLVNLRDKLSKQFLKQHHDRLAQMAKCSGPSCRAMSRSPSVPVISVQ